MHTVGLIAGHGWTKAASAAHSVVFPSVAAPAAAADFTAATGTSRRAICLDDGSDWLVGRDALDLAPARIVAILDRARYRSPSFVALVRAALGHVAPEPAPLRIMAGMPAAWFADQAARADLEAAIVQAAAPWGDTVVMLAPEPAGIFYSYVFAAGSLDVARTRGDVGVIDAGFRDVGVAHFSNGRYVAGESIPGGAAVALREIRRLIAAAYGLELPLHEVDAVLRAGEIIVDGAARPLPEGAAGALLGGLEPVVAAGRSLWPNGGRGLRTLLLGGGGAYHLAAALQTHFPQLHTVEGPQIAGARGFACALAAQAARRAA